MKIATSAALNQLQDEVVQDLGPESFGHGPTRSTEVAGELFFAHSEMNKLPMVDIALWCDEDSIGLEGGGLEGDDESLLRGILDEIGPGFQVDKPAVGEEAFLGQAGPGTGQPPLVATSMEPPPSPMGLEIFLNIRTKRTLRPRYVYIIQNANMPTFRCAYTRCAGREVQLTSPLEA